MRPISDSGYRFLVSALLLFSFSVPLTFTKAESAEAYEEKAFLPAESCYCADISPDGKVIYAAGQFGDWDAGVRLYDASTYEHVRDIHSFPKVPKYILASADGIHLYATAYYQGAVAKIRVSDGAVVKSISVGPWPVGMVFDSARRYLYVMVNGPYPGAVGSISIIDTSTDTVVGTIGPIVHAGTVLAISPDDQFLYALSFDYEGSDPQTLYKMTIADRSVQAVPGVRVGGISVSPDGQLLYVADRFAGEVRVFQTSSMTETASIPIADVHSFWVAPSGDHGLAVCLAPESGELLIRVVGLPDGEILQTLSHTLELPDTISFFPLVDPVFWNRTTGEALIPIFREHGGVIVISPTWEAGQVVYETDFSTDPNWTTNSSDNFHWNEADGNYYFKRQNGSEQYSYKSIPYDPDATYRLEFDACLTRCDWAADLFLSLSDPDMHIATATTWQVSYHNVDQGKTASLIYYDSEGGSYHPGGAQPAPFQLNTWYHNVVVYDPAAGTLSLRVTRVSDGSLVGQQELTGVGSFPGVDRLSISAVGHTYASGAIAEGYIDNLVLKKYSPGELQVVYQTDFSSDPGWITDQPDNYYWNETAGTYHATVENDAPAYSPNRYFYTPVALTGDSFEIQWDIKMTRVDWSAGVSFGLFDENIAFAGFNGGQGVCLEFANPDAGRLIWLYICGAGGLASASSPGGTYALHTSYTCKLSYDAGAGEISAELSLHDSGSILWSKTLTVPGGFTQPLTKLGGSRSGFGETGGGYSGVNRWGVAEAEIDNVVFRGAAAGPQAPVVTQFAINDGAESTESRTVTLNNATTNTPTHYMASEDAAFSGASWQPYSTAPQFTLSEGDGLKTVYFKTKNEAGESNVLSDSIVLQERAWEVVYQTDFSSDPNWTTNDAANLSWDAETQTFHGWQANTNTSYAYVPVELRPNASFRLEFDVRINFIEWSAGLTFGLFDSRLMYNAGAAIEYGYYDVGYTTALYAGNPSGPPDWNVSNWEIGVWYRNVVEYDATSRVIRFEASPRDDGSIVSQLSLSGIRSFPPGMVLLGVSRIHMAGYNNAAVDFNLDNIILEEFYQPPKREVEILPLAGPLLRISWDSEDGLDYQLQATSDLSSAEWAPVGPRMGGTGEKLYVDDYIDGIARRFYRVEIISLSAKSVGYAVVASQSTVEAQGWGQVVDTLLSRHEAELVSYDGSPFPSRVRDQLAAYHPRYVCFVAPAPEVTDAFVQNVHQLTRQLDDDPFGDCVWGIITGATHEHALRLSSSPSRIEIQKALLKTAGSYLEWLPAGVYHSEGDNDIIWLKEPGGEIEKREDGPYDDTEPLVAGLNSGDYQLFVTSGHASEFDWQLHYPHPDGEGFFYASNGELYAIDHDGARHDVTNSQPLVYWAPGNCLIGRIAASNSMALGWLGSGGAVQFCGYIVPTWYGYMGWGLNDYFLKLQDRFSFAEAFFLTNQALIFDQLKETPGTNPDGLQYDKDALVFYGDPAIRAVVVPSREPLYDQSLALSEIPGDGAYRISLTVTLQEEAEIPRPVIAFLPFRIVPTETVVEVDETSALEITDDLILAQIWTEGHPPLSAGRQFALIFSCRRAA
jgi:zinc protease